MRIFLVLICIFLSPSSLALKLEAGTVALPATHSAVPWTRVTFQQSYETVPAIFTLPTEENSVHPTLIRIQNVDMSGFDIAQFESEGEDGGADAMTVGYMVIEEGVHVLPGGAQLEVGKIVTGLCQGLVASCSKGWVNVSWLATYTGTPGIITAVQTNNSNPTQQPGSPLIPTMAAAIDNASSSGMKITLERAETTGTNAVETIAYMAIENGKVGEMFSDGAPGILYETIITPKNVYGYQNGCYRSSYLNTYPQEPFVVGAQNDRAGNNGGWLRRCMISLTEVGFHIEEDRQKDGERSHTREIVAAMAFEKPFYFNSEESTCSGTHVESWDSATYTSQEGSENWNSDWIEIGDDGTATGGNLRIDSGDLLFTGNTGTQGSVTIERQFDLTDFDESYFTYSFEKVGTLDADDDVLVHASGDGGINWTLVYTIEGSNPNASGLISHDITSYIATNTRIRFTFVDNSGSGCCFEGTKGIRIKKVDISSAADDCSNVIDHFDIDHDGKGLTCDEEHITIRAVDTKDIRVFDYDKTATIATSTGEGDWTLIEGKGTFTAGAANSGTATYVYHEDDSGVAKFGLSHVNEGTFSINVADTSLVTESSGAATAANDPDIAFESAGFRVIDASDDPIPSKMVAGTGLSNIFLQAVSTNPVTKACEGVFKSTTSVDVDLGTRCVDPNSCILGKQVTITNNSATTTLPNPENQIGGKNKVAVSLLFGADSKAAIEINYPDVGRIALDAEYEVSSSSTMTGTAETVSKPADLKIVEASIKSLDSTPVLNPKSDDPTEAKFIAAGKTFTLQVRAENSAGALTPNFGKEATPETVKFTPTHIAPTGADFKTDSSLNQIGTMSVSGGLLSFSGSNGLSFPEVGAITIKASIEGGQYLGEGDVTGTSSVTIGRFYPSYLVVTSNSKGSWETSCSVDTPFVYAGAEMTYDTEPTLTISAKNASNGTLINYQDSWMRLTAAGFTEVSKSRNTADSIDISLSQSGGTFSDISDNDGTFIYTLSTNDKLSADHTTKAPFEPTSLAVELSYSEIKDLDGAVVSDLTMAKFTPDASEVRFGRLKVANAVGPDDRDLTIPITPEYFLGNIFVTNTDDSCTTYNSANINLGVAVPPAATTRQGSGTFDEGLVVTPMELTATNTFTEIPFVYEIPSPSYDYLKYDWDNDGTNDDDPEGKATFGLYEGRKPIIFQREVIGR